MKTLNNYFILLFCVVVIYGCNKQNMPVPEAGPMRPALDRSEQYFANLRAYKKSKHQIYFGWFGGTGGEGNPDVPGVLDQIPDSVDIVACWGGVPPVGSYNHSVMQKTREQKGTRFVVTMFGSGVEALMRRNFPALSGANLMAAIDSVARSIADTVLKFQLDGFDLDYEPAYGDRSIFGDSGGSGATNDPHTQQLFKALSKYLGPKSGTDKLLIIDGQFDIGIEPYVNYLMQQSYGSASATALQGRLTNFGGGVLPPEKFVPTENFEDFWEKGGVNFTDPIRGIVPSLLGMAYWNPVQGPKGGCGTYHPEYEYPLNPDYKFTRQAIQIMNPAAK